MTQDSGVALPFPHDAAKDQENHFGPTNRLYGRSRSRTWTTTQAQIMKECLPAWEIDLACVSTPHTLFTPAPESVWLEVGFGHGEHLTTLAQQHPDRGYLGAEGYLSGVAHALQKIAADKLSNVRLFSGDARRLMHALGSSTLAGIIILFSDPWPKARHHKRRVFNASFLEEATRICMVGGCVRFASDALDYAADVAQLLDEHLAWAEILDCQNNQRPSSAAWPITRYERKALQAGRGIRYIEFQKLARQE